MELNNIPHFERGSFNTVLSTTTHRSFWTRDWYRPSMPTTYKQYILDQRLEKVDVNNMPHVDRNILIRP